MEELYQAMIMTGNSKRSSSRASEQDGGKRMRKITRRPLGRLIDSGTNQK